MSNRHWHILDDASQSLNIVELATKHDGLVVVLVSDINSLTSLANELQFLAKNLPILTLSDWETLPYDRFSPHQDLISQRLLTLYELLTIKRGILLVAVTTALHRLPPREHIAMHSLVLRQGQTVDLLKLRNSLSKNGYRSVEQVMERGEFGVRGSILDVFPTGSISPYRIDFFGNEVDTIRKFNPENQCSSEKVENIKLLPAKEYQLDDKGISHFSQQWERYFGESALDSPIYQNVVRGINFSGIEYYISLFFNKINSLFDYLPDNSTIVHLPNAHKAAEDFWQEVNRRYEQLRYDSVYPILPPKEIFIPVPDFFAQNNKFSQVVLSFPSGNDNNGLPDLTIKRNSENPLGHLQEFLTVLLLDDDIKRKVLFCAESLGRKEALLNLLKRINIQPIYFASWHDFLNSNAQFGITIAQFNRGMWLKDIVLIPEALLFEPAIIQRRRSELSFHQNSEGMIKDLTELQVGDPIVHSEYGIGRYLGLQTITTENQLGEYLTIEYADQAKLYVPITSLHLIGRYLGANPENVEYSHLGSKQWEKAKYKALEKIRDVAAELLDVYARRESSVGFAFPKPMEQYQAFAESFPFEPSIDQQKAIDAVIDDMISPRCMDRLICGDVGFGKTEVAMRAAFIAVCAVKQVAILVPTTILGQQHYQTFQDRFANWPINIGLLSRFTSTKQQKELIEKLSTGKIDIIIGTHKLLQSNIKFKDLGLLIIDEEHRFGVRQKEKIKSFRANIDILTLTATPIPRTLNISLAGIRDLSIIATPPAKRLSIKTFVRERNNHLIREAILREILRGGQVYFLHNNIETISKVAADIEKLMPEAKIAVAHGQLRECQLEPIMRDFYHRHCNILVCTTIIESGIDIPTANTIIIDHADRFGLAQLHQLRGRVGRSHHQAYAYLLISSREAITKDAIKRLDVIEAMEDLGAGFTLAMHDLEIRGAGEILGEEQSGQIQAIGFNLYMEFLDQTVNLLKSGKELDLNKSLNCGSEVDLVIPALIPDNYVGDVHTRLVLYKRIANASSDSALRNLQIELIDRFGLLPASTKNLIAITELKLKVEGLGISKIKAGIQQGYLEFIEQPKIQPLTIINLIQKYPDNYKLEGQYKLKFNFPQNKTAEDLLKGLDALIKGLK
jgi:transcription-repair coupling factor (superfamily II helicase)